jgi:hypothetical protein
MSVRLAAALAAAVTMAAPAASLAQAAFDPSDHVLTGWKEVCLSNSTETRTSQIQTTIDGLIRGFQAAFKGATSLEAKYTIVRGARVDLPAAIAAIEDDHIRTCMIDLYRTNYPQTPQYAVPSYIPFRFTYTVRKANRKILADENLTVHYRTRNQIFDPRPVASLRDPLGKPFYEIFEPLPPADDQLFGVIAPESNQRAQLNAPSTATPFCLQRGETPPSPANFFDYYDCEEQVGCRPGFSSTRVLSPCPPQRASLDQAPRLLQAAYAADSDTGGDHWIVRSAESLLRNPQTSQGFSIVSFRTAAFQDPDVIGVQVEVRVDGVLLEEDGVSPAERPVPNDPASSFKYSFAVEALDLDGRYAGCDAIELRLTPLRRGGGTGPAQTVTLPYIPLRDSAPREERLGDRSLTWSALYFRPAPEWRNEAFVGSVQYAPGQGEAAEARARHAVEAVKAWIGARHLSLDGQPVIGVIRPPLVADARGLVAYGVALGVIDADHQVRFTFPVETASRIHELVRARRGESGGAQFIRNEKYIRATRPNHEGSHRIEGICTEVPMASNPI